MQYLLIFVANNYENSINFGFLTKVVIRNLNLKNAFRANVSYTVYVAHAVKVNAVHTFIVNIKGFIFNFVRLLFNELQILHSLNVNLIIIGYLSITICELYVGIKMSWNFYQIILFIIKIMILFLETGHNYNMPKL